MFTLLICAISLFYVGITHGQYVVDMSSGVGRRYDGIGGLSGGGATSKLLINYPQKERNEILDYLFLPNYAASLQVLKVEIGGDSQSTDGTESSHMHEANDENYQRGYEWWLMQEAKKRNPDIKLWGLPWAFPGWIGKGGQNPYINPNMTAGYIIKWILGAKTHYNLTIDYIGIWNERNYDITYIKTLRKMLDNENLQHVRICAADNEWGIADDMLKDQELMDAIDFIGAHYPGTTTTNNAVQTGKQLWSSEDYSTFNDNTGAGCWARILNQNYVNGNMTSTTSWNLIAAYYQNLRFGRDGLMTAMEPWSGHYVVESPIWITAHTTQFTEVGWSYLRHGSGAGHLDEGGSYVSLVSPDGKDLTIIVETMSHDHSKCIRPGLPAYNVSDSQLVTLKLKGSFASITKMNVFYSKLGFGGKPTIMFEKSPPALITGGEISFEIGIDMIATFTTLGTGQKGQYDPPPPSKEFPLPYYDTFNGYKEYEEAVNFVPQIGVFEVRSTSDPKHGKVNMQVMLERAVDWCAQVNHPITVGGNYKWKDVIVGLDAYLPSTAPANATFVAARISSGGCGIGKATGIFFSVNPLNQTYQVTGDLKKSVIFKEGNLKLDASSWYRQVLNVRGDAITGSVNGQTVFSIEVKTDSQNGFVGYGSDSFGNAMFDNFMVEDSVKYIYHSFAKRIIAYLGKTSV